MMEMTPTVSPVTAMMMPITIHPAPVLRIVLYIFSIFIAFPVGNMLLCLGAILLIVSVDGCLYLIVDDYLAIYFFIIEVLHHICHGNDGGSGETV